LEGYEERSPGRESPLAIGYFARVAPEKGLHNLVDAYRTLRKRKDLPPTRLEVAGYLGREHRGYLARLERELDQDGLSGEYRYHGTLDRKGKIDFLKSLDIVSVPTDYEEPKGIFLLEAMACGVPAVQPRRGAFPELLTRTGGGRLVRAGDNAGLASGLADLVLDGAARRELGKKAARGVRRHYTVEQMAGNTAAVLERIANGDPLQVRETKQAGVGSN
ncbi:MAG: glycosyltransferase family 4 protein, partial [Vicinamibacteria bacterium]